MRHSAAAILVAALLCAAAPERVLAGDAATVAAPAHVEKTFLIPSADGYGVGECLTGANSACGQVVANAWCESQGYATAASYGVAERDEYTGAIDSAPKIDERPIRITCQD